jgi:hypothetical protein
MAAPMAKIRPPKETMVLAAAPVASAGSLVEVAVDSSSVAVAVESLSVASDADAEAEAEADAAGVDETMTTSVPLMVMVELTPETMGVGAEAGPVAVSRAEESSELIDERTDSRAEETDSTAEETTGTAEEATGTSDSSPVGTAVTSEVTVSTTVVAGGAWI